MNIVDSCLNVSKTERTMRGRCEKMYHAAYFYARIPGRSMIKREICKFLIDFWDLSDKCCVAINHIWNQLTFSLQDKLTRRNARRKNTKKKDWDKERHRKTANTRKKISLSHSFFNKYKRTLSIVYNSMRKYILRLHRKRKCCHYKKEMLSILAPSSDNVKETLLLSSAVKIKMPEVENSFAKLSSNKIITSKVCASRVGKKTEKHFTMARNVSFAK